MVITGEKRRFKNMAKKEIFQSEEKIENKKKRDSKASFKDFLFSGWILIGQQMSFVCYNFKPGKSVLKRKHKIKLKPNMKIEILTSHKMAEIFLNPKKTIR